LLGLGSIIHFVLFLICFYIGFIWKSGVQLPISWSLVVACWA
jgi:hypothetical protein